MTTKKISELTQVDAVAAGDKVPILDISTASTLYATFTQIAAFLASLTQTLSGKTIDGASNTLTARIASDVSGLATGIATFLGTPTGANLAAALTTALPDSKGGTGLTALAAGIATFLGTPSGANLASALTTALPDTKGGTGLTALGTGVATFLGTPSGANLGTALSSSLSGAKVDTTLIGAQNVVSTGAGSFGTNPGSTGDVKLPNAGAGIVFRNAANNADKSGLCIDASDNVIVGGSIAHATQSVSTTVEGSGSVILRVGANTIQSVSSSAVSMTQPLTGNGVAWSAVNATGTQAMADANQTPASSVYRNIAIVTTGANTADRNLTLPTATDTQSYAKLINNTCTGAFSVVVKCASGTTVSVANGKTAWVLVDSRGVTRMTADV